MSACGGGASSQSSSDRVSAETATLSSIQVQHLCNVSSTNFATEDEIKANLVALLEAEGLSYATWKDWRDSLVDSPARASQLAVAQQADCP